MYDVQNLLKTGENPPIVKNINLSAEIEIREMYCVRTYLTLDLPVVENKFTQRGNTEFSNFYCNWLVKGTVSRDFRLLVFFMNQFPPSI
jgi:hypothetical protein